ncbi:MAG: ribulose-phosphate 3-epimerase [Bacteroidota bacterium]
MNHLIAPSLLSANFLNLSADIQMINQSNADWFHIDIMDGVFVPNISIGFPIIEAIKKEAKKPLDIHLMIVEPDKYIDRFVIAGADIITVHYEACPHLNRSIQHIKQQNVKAGVVLNPHTPVFLLEDIICDCDVVLLMSVNPGFGGQKFIENTYQKIEALRSLIERKNAKTLIEIDGGVDDTNAKKMIDAGANILVAGNYVFKATDPLMAIDKIKYL